MPVDASAAKSIFLAALERPDRAAFLDSACAGDTDLRARVEELLKAHEAGSFPDFAAGADDTRTVAHTPDDPTRTGGAGPPADGPDLSFLAPPQEPGHLGRLDHFEILSVVGQGGMGVVLKAHDDSLDRIVAIKVLGSQYAANGAARRRFIREARAVAAVLNEHVVAIYEINEQVPFLVMQFVAGVSLQERIDRSGPLPPIEVLRIGMQIARGLAAAHAQGIVHRDIKPANILLENGVERVKITDFGLARAVDDASVTQSGVIAGTPMYMSPEQARGEAVDPRSDLFSLGSVLYAMCTGHAPFRASGTMAVLKRVIEDDPRPVRELNPDVPDWLDAITCKLLAKRPGDRFPAAGDIAQLLEQHLAHERQPTVVPMPPAVERPRPATARPRSRRRRGLRWVAIAGLLFALFVGVQYVRNKGVDSIYRSVRNRSAVRIDLWDSNLDHIQVKRDGADVATLDSGHSSVELAPGTYALELVGRPGYRPRTVTYDTSGMGPTMREHVRATDGRYGMILYRGDEFRVFVVMEPTALTPPKVLESMVGTWATELTRRPEASKGDGPKEVGRGAVEPVAGGRYCRMYVKGSGPDGLLVRTFDPDKGEFADWYFDARGFAFGSIFGRFDSATQTLTTTQLRPELVQSVTQHRWLDADTIRSTTTSRDQKGTVRFDGEWTWRRQPGAAPPDETTGGAGPIPRELAVLDRLVGTWDTEMASRVRPGEKGRAEMTVRKTLGGRFVEVRERVLPSGEEHYTLYTFDPPKRSFRNWYFSSRWPPAEGTGTWDEAAKTMSWSCHGGGQTTTLVWKFASDDRIEFRVTVKDGGGKVLEDLEGTHTRRKPPG
jgi:serine/threonine protein kinase